MANLNLVIIAYLNRSLPSVLTHQIEIMISDTNSAILAKKRNAFSCPRFFPTLVFLAVILGGTTLIAADRPNILFIAIDDQNDWIGPMGGHPMAKTPYLDQLANRGTTFLNAHCNAPLCNPSRTSLLLGLRPTTTGIYGLAPWFRTLPEWKDRVALPQHFANHGYRTAATGKIYHGGTGNGYRNDRILAKLKDQVEVKFNGVGLAAVMSRFEKTLDFPIIIDEKALEDEGISLDEKITLQLSQEVSFRNALKLVLDPLNLTWVIEDGVMRITTKPTSPAVTRVYDSNAKKGNSPAVVPEFQVTAPFGGVGTKPPKKLVGDTPMGNNPLMDWGVWPLDNDDSQKGDYQVASWTVEQIKSAPRDQPFFIAAGFFLPHVPCYATQKWFDLYPDDDSVLPTILEGDRTDTPRFSWYIHWELPEPRLKWVKENNQWRNLVRSYLASTSFVDAQIGRLLTALEESGHAENTIVVVWGDHGWHLGEKEITGKNTLWDDGTRVPLLFAGPGIAKGQRCTQPAELLDIYPTLIDLTGVSNRNDLEGLSLLPQLKNANAKRERPAVTSHNQGNHGVRSERWRYIHYADGSEELYDMINDPNEWKNIVGDPAMKPIIDDHKKWLPKIDLPPAPNSANRILTYDKNVDEAIWEGKKIKRSDPIPQ